MCGRYVFKEKKELLTRTYYATPSGELIIGATYNVAPTFEMPVVLTKSGVRIIDSYRWGLLPFWAKEMNVSYKMINARSETLSEKASFKNPFKNKRCIVPVSGFYEWKKSPDGKIPHYIYPSEGKLMSFAGLYENWKSPDGQIVNSYTIITTQPNNKMNGIHDRMPAILFGNEIDTWLNPDNQNIQDLQELLRPAPDDSLDYHIVSTEVNSPRNQGRELIDPV